jgi:lysine 2,3-aminomutase
MPAPKLWPPLGVGRRLRALHHLDRAPGTAHFRTTMARGQELMRALRTRYSGLCQPTYVMDGPDGEGKVPVGLG